MNKLLNKPEIDQGEDEEIEDMTEFSPAQWDRHRQQIDQQHDRDRLVLQKTREIHELRIEIDNLKQYLKQKMIEKNHTAEEAKQKNEEYQVYSSSDEFDLHRNINPYICHID